MNQLPVVPSSYGAPLGRRRTKDLDLPPRLYRRGSSYYYVSGGKWTWLARDKPEALRLWALLECRQSATTVGELVSQWLPNAVKRDGKPLSESTRRQYGCYVKAIGERFPIAASALTLQDIMRWQIDCPRGWFNGCLSVMRSAYKWGVKAQLVSENPLRDAEFNYMPVRGRLVSDAEFRAIREHAPTWLQIAMDLAYLTGLRESDVLALRWDALVDGAILVQQIKTGARQRFEVSPEVKDVLARARNRAVVGFYVVATDKGRPIKPKRLQEAFARAREAAGVADAVFHDIRGKAATDAAADGLDYQALLGHSSRRMSDRYVKAKQTIKAPTLRRNIG